MYLMWLWCKPYKLNLLKCMNTDICLSFMHYKWMWCGAMYMCINPCMSCTCIAYLTGFKKMLRNSFLPAMDVMLLIWGSSMTYSESNYLVMTNMLSSFCVVPQHRSRYVQCHLWIDIIGANHAVLELKGCDQRPLGNCSKTSVCSSRDSCSAIRGVNEPVQTR